MIESIALQLSDRQRSYGESIQLAEAACRWGNMQKSNDLAHSLVGVHADLEKSPITVLVIWTYCCTKEVLLKRVLELFEDDYQPKRETRC